MSYSIILPDKTFVELILADTYSGPNNCFSRLHCNTNSVFCRINNGIWKLTTERSLHKARIWLELCEDVKDVEGLIRD